MTWWRNALAPALFALYVALYTGFRFYLESWEDLAVRILAASDPRLREEMEDFQEALADAARAKGKVVRGDQDRAVGFS